MGSLVRYMVEKWSLTIPQLTQDEQRNVYVYIPASYKKNPTLRYPVMYMFDGHNVFFDQDATYGKSWGMKEYMDKHRIQMIIVAPECNHDSNWGRLKEYSPYSFTTEMTGRIVGKGKVTMDWMTKTLKPMIDERYPTLRDRKHTYIAGSSMGGLMSLYAVLKYNRVFSKAACLSPSLWVLGEKLETMIQRSSIREDTVIYMDYGSNEMGSHENMMKPFSQATSLLLEKKALLNVRIVPNGDHCEACWEKQIPFFMNTLRYTDYKERSEEKKKEKRSERSAE